jgi:hypothetical protein
MIIRVSFAVIGPFIGSLSAGYSLSFALKLGGILLLSLSLIAGLFVFLTLENDMNK